MKRSQPSYPSYIRQTEMNIKELKEARKIIEFVKKLYEGKGGMPSALYQYHKNGEACRITINMIDKTIDYMKQEIDFAKRLAEYEAEKDLEYDKDSQGRDNGVSDANGASEAKPPAKD